MKKFFFVLILVVIAVVALWLMDSGKSGGECEPIESEIALKMPVGCWAKVLVTEEYDMSEKGLMGITYRGSQEVNVYLECLRVDKDGVMTILQSWDAIKLTGMSKGTPYQWDSELPKQKRVPECLMWMQLKNIDIEVKVRPDGSIEKILGAEDLAAAYIQVHRLDDDMSEEDKQDLLELMTEKVEKACENILDGILPSYPQGPLKVGQKYFVKGRAAVMVQVDNALELTYKGVRAGQAVFDNYQEILAGSSTATMGIGQASSIEKDTEVTAQGELTVDLETGLYSCDMAGTIKFVQRGEVLGLAQNKDMTGTWTGSVKIFEQGD